MNRYSRPGSLLLAALLWMCNLFGNPAEACTVQGCVMAGPRLASIDSTRGALLNVLLGNLTGSTVNANVLDWQTLAAGNVNVASMIDALQASVGASTPSQALTANATLLQILNAAAASTVGGNAVNVQGSLNNLAVPLSVVLGNIHLGELLSITGAPGNSTINALDLVTGVVQLYNYKNVLTTPTPIGISIGSIAGLTGVASITIAAQVVEPPVYVCGPTGTQFHTAAIRVKLNITLPTTPPITGSALDGLVGVSASSITLLSNFSLYLEVARADGTIGTLNAITNSFSVQATPGVADLYLGSISDTLFFNRTRALSASDFGFVDIGSLTLTVTVLLVQTSVSGSIKMKSTSHGASPSPSTLTFNPPYPQTQTVSAGGTFITNLVSSLLTNLQVNVSLNVLPILNLDLSISGLLQPILSGVLTPVLNSVVTTLVNPLLDLLGIRLGEAVISTYGVYQLCTVAGVAYNDANHTARQEIGETGTGLTLYAKLVATSSPATVYQSAVVNPATGTFSFSNVTAASYNVLIDTNTTVADVTPGVTAGWIGTETPTLSRSFTITTLDIANQSFGIYNGSSISGRVFKDTGTGGGIPNNVIRDGAEASLPGVAIKVSDSSGATTYDSTTAGDTGAYTLWIPQSAGNVALKIVESNLASYASTGAAVGNTGGTYDRTTDTITFTHTSGTLYSNVNFADVPSSQFDTDGRQSVLPGNVAFYPHAFTAGTAGQITFTGTAPATQGWSHTIYRDTNCNGAIDAGESQLAAAVAVTESQKVCLVVRVFAATTAEFNAQYPVTVSASFAYTNSSIVEALSRGDLTLVGSAADAGLHLAKTVDKASAKSGDVLLYTITYTNHSNGPLTALKIFDSTPAYTTFTSAACGTLATGLTGCVLSQKPAAGATGAVEWTMSGALTAGASGSVTFQVTVQ